MKTTKEPLCGIVPPLVSTLLKLGEIYRIGRHASAVIKGMKCALSLMGICNDAMAEPLSRFAPPEKARVRSVLEELGLMPGSGRIPLLAGS